MIQINTDRLQLEIDPATEKIPLGVSMGRPYKIIGYITSEYNGGEQVEAWIVIGDRGQPVHLWPRTVIVCTV